MLGCFEKQPYGVQKHQQVFCLTFIAPVIHVCKNWKKKKPEKFNRDVYRKYNRRVATQFTLNICLFSFCSRLVFWHWLLTCSLNLLYEWICLVLKLLVVWQVFSSRAVLTGKGVLKCQQSLSHLRFEENFKPCRYYLFPAWRESNTYCTCNIISLKIHTFYLGCEGPCDQYVSVL